jgi:hypothetical protein
MSKLEGLPNVVPLALDVTQTNQIAAAAKAVSEKTGEGGVPWTISSTMQVTTISCPF